jgi:predicted metal-dependent hydrolase
MLQIDKIIRSKRRTFALEIDNQGRLIVRAPARATRAQIEALVVQKSDWIQARQAEVLSQGPLPVNRQYLPGETFLFLGQTYTLEIVECQAEALLLDGKFLLARSAQAKAAEVFESWYRRQAFDILSQRTALYAGQTGLRYQQVRVKNLRTRWGSCSNRGNLNFNLRLVMAPLEIVDYIVVHELVHMIHKNHSRLYWDAVAAILPDYKIRRNWLKLNGHTLVI